MTKYVSLLRGIMPSNPNMRNEKLRGLFEKLGFKNVSTVITSGNVLFEAESTNQLELESRIEEEITANLGFSSRTIIRSQSEINLLVASNPFGNISESKQAKPNVTFFKTSPKQIDLPTSSEQGFKAYGFESGAFCYTVDISTVKTPEVMLMLEKRFGKDITTRTWNTVLRIHRLMNILK